MSTSVIFAYWHYTICLSAFQVCPTSTTCKLWACSILSPVCSLLSFRPGADAAILRQSSTFLRCLLVYHFPLSNPYPVFSYEYHELPLLLLSDQPVLVIPFIRWHRNSRYSFRFTSTICDIIFLIKLHSVHYITLSKTVMLII